jgi:hypothetical protein
MQGVGGSNPLSSTTGQRPCSALTAHESPASGSKSAAICLCEANLVVRHVVDAGQNRRCRRPVDRATGTAATRPVVPTKAGLAGHGKVDRDRPGDLILIRVLHPWSVPQDRSYDLLKRCTVGDRCEPLVSDGMWTKRGPGTQAGDLGGWPRGPQHRCKLVCRVNGRRRTTTWPRHRPRGARRPGRGPWL